MSTQPKREEEFDKEFVGEGKIDPITAIGIKNWIKQVEYQTILRCVEELSEWKEELEEIRRQTAIERDEKLIAIYLSQIDALDTAINKLQDLTK